MNIEQLVVNQQLEIESQKERLQKILKSVEKVYSALFCIGAPLNDNIINLNDEQLQYFSQHVGGPTADLLHELRKSI